ncbi:hypothetical protein [Rhodoblastus sp.]|uniref:hypothetical protein n=1 Tax=Rhodoblastus sp. TaxID=1962975 RepID=UPI003F94986B
MTSGSVVSGFSINNGNPNGVWAYGEGTAGSTFTAFSNKFSTGFGPVDYWQSSNPVYSVPLVGENTGSSPYVAGTLMIPTGVLWVHPGQNDDVLVQFTAPKSGNYDYAGGFELLDTSPTGVIGEIFDNGTQIYSGALTGPGANQGTLAPGQSESFAGSVYLNAGDHLTFAVNNAGNVFDDSTGLTAAVTSVPELSTWVMMLAGSAGLGFLGYRRNKGATLAA